jgi:hypothetical protein
MKSDFTIVIDKAESHRWPYAFPGPTVIGELRAGSYSVQGFETEVAIKRVTAEQLFAGCGTNRTQFLEEIERLAEIPAAHLVIETTLEGIFSDPPAESRMRSAGVASSLVAWVNRYAIAIWPVGSRECGERWARGICNRWLADATQGAMDRSLERRARRMAREVMKQFPQPVAQPEQPAPRVGIGVG